MDTIEQVVAQVVGPSVAWMKNGTADYDLEQIARETFAKIGGTYRQVATVSEFWISVDRNRRVLQPSLPAAA